MKAIKLKFAQCTSYLIYDFPKITAWISNRSSSTSELHEFKRDPVSYFDNALFMSIKFGLGVCQSIIAAKSNINISIGFAYCLIL